MRCACLAILALTAIAAGWPDSTFVSRVPASANAVLAADVAAAFRSPLAQKEGWSRRFAETQQATLGSLPPSVETVLVAAQFNFCRMTPNWIIAQQNSSRLITLADVARAEGSTIGRIADQMAVTSRRDAIFASLGDRQLAVYAPADRQAFARWLRTSSSGTGPSPYLRRAVSDPGGAQVVIAADLTDAVNIDAARALLPHLPAGVKSNLSAALLANTFAAIEGFVLRVNINETMTGRLQIDFTTPVGSVGPHVAGIVRDVLGQIGASVDDLDAWPATVAERSIVMEGPLSTVGLRQLSTLFELPESAVHTAPAGAGTAGADMTPIAPATQAYFRSLSTIIEELRRFRANLETERGFTRYAMWHETAARRIDALPTTRVDPGLIDFGAWVASSLRAIAVSLRGVPIQTQKAGAGAFTITNGWPGWNPWWGFNNWSVETNVPEVRARQAQVVADDAKARLDAWRHIDDGLAAERRRLSEKYRAAF